jgi:hypothetical protein
VLPILYGDRFVGRFEPRIDRAAGLVRVLNAWWEPGFDPRRDEAFVGAMRDALRAYLGFARARSIEWAAALSRERRMFGVRPRNRNPGRFVHTTAAPEGAAGAARRPHAARPGTMVSAEAGAQAAGPGGSME